MACADPFLQLDDQSFALQLQLEEIEAQRELQSGKWTEDSPPDFTLAFDDFEAELKKAIVLVEDLKFAPVFEHLPQFLVQCSVSGESGHPYFTMRLVCSDIYCKPCLKSFFMRVVKDKSLFPPKCHGQPIDISTIEADFSVEVLTAYRSAELEFTSTDRVYCADPEYAKFIPMPQRTHDYASCETCSVGTCMHCKALAHDRGCPADESRQSLINFADEQGWKPCFGCG